MQPHWGEAAIVDHGELILEGFPFEPGQPVEVLVVLKAARLQTAGDASLRDSLIEFREPLEPVASEDWDALAVILLDTHIWVWWVAQPDRLQAKHRDLLDRGAGRVFGLSIISCWEVAEPVEYGRLKLDREVGL